MCWGLDSTYALDQLANKYSTAARGNGRPITACDLSGSTPRLLPALSVWLLQGARASQRHFGSAVYMPLMDGAIYRVVMTQNGLNAEAVNPVARRPPPAVCRYLFLRKLVDRKLLIIIYHYPGEILLECTHA